MPRSQLLVRFGYDGSRFHGLQPQPGYPTAGGALKARVEEALGERARGLAFAARTDAGVHCLKNAATCWVTREVLGKDLIEIDRPRDDGLFNVSTEGVPISVHARGSSEGKRYRYIVDARSPRDALLESKYSWRIAPDLDIDRVREEARPLLGAHDFSAFRAARCEAKNPIKELRRVDVDGPYPLPSGGARYYFNIEGSAFLRRMIRIMVGALVEVGTGWRPPGVIAHALQTKSRQDLGLTAPARGLTLLEVFLNRAR